VADQVDANHRCRSDQVRPNLVPAAHAAGEAVQQHQRRAAALDFDMVVEAVDARQHTPTGLSASATTRQT
jgi:hypothetical protein